MTSVEVAGRSPLHARHCAAGARFGSFAGWELPIHFGDGIQAEHHAVRTGVAVFDISHMGRIETRGQGASALLQRLLSNDVSAIAVGGAQYSVLCRADGGVIDDVFSYRLADDEYLTVTNAANHATDLGWFRQHAGAFAAEVSDRIADYAMVAVQGPQARGLLEQIATGPLPARLRAGTLQIGGVDVLACGTGYTGEDGLELLMAPDAAARVWDQVVGAGAKPAGLGARDTLRIEACYPLYGNELTEHRNPIEAGLGWCCKEATGFIGAGPVIAARVYGTTERLVALRMVSPGIPRAGNAIVGGGVVTSGGFSPCLRCGVVLAYVASERSQAGTMLEIDVRGRRRQARVVTRPLYPPAE